jgi:hypothetical protein
MKNKLLLTLFFSVLTFQYSYSQVDTTYGWTPLGVVSFNISQIALSNWTQGGTNSISWAGIGRGGANYKNPEWNFRSDLKIAYGQTKLGGEDFRTNENEFFLEKVVSKVIAWPIDPYFSNTIRTVVAKGYIFEDGIPIETANFFDPGYITQSLGFIYDRTNFQFRAGVAIQEVFANRHAEQYTDDPETAELEKFKFETGIESAASLDQVLAENLLFQTKLRLFSRFDSMDVWDVRWDNGIVAKINDFLNVNVTYLLIYELAQSPTAQMKQALQLSFVYALL